MSSELAHQLWFGIVDPYLLLTYMEPTYTWFVKNKRTRRIAENYVESSGVTYYLFRSIPFSCLSLSRLRLLQAGCWYVFGGKVSGGCDGSSTTACLYSEFVDSKCGCSDLLLPYRSSLSSWQVVHPFVLLFMLGFRLSEVVHLLPNDSFAGLRGVCFVKRHDSFRLNFG